MWGLLESMLIIAVCVIGLLISNQGYRRFALQTAKVFCIILCLTFFFKWLPAIISSYMSDTFPQLPAKISIAIEVTLCAAAFYAAVFAVCAWRDQVDAQRRYSEKHLNECRDLVKDWMPPEDYLMQDSFYRQRKALEKERSWDDTDWRQPGNVTMETILRDCRERKANELAQQIAMQEVEKENERIRRFNKDRRKQWLDRFRK